MKPQRFTHTFAATYIPLDLLGYAEQRQWQEIRRSVMQRLGPAALVIDAAREFISEPEIKQYQIRLTVWATP